MQSPDVSQLVRNADRFREVVGTLAKYGLAGWLGNVQADWAQKLLKDSRASEVAAMSREARIREAVTELGTTFIKLGQMLSTRPDLVGPELANEFAQLRTGTPPDPPSLVREIVEKELDATIEERFKEFDLNAMASASIGQVHKAQLPDGKPVVVKVQHPGIEERIRNDLEIMTKLAELAEKHSAELRRYQPVGTTADFARTLLKELDFRSEQRNLEKFRRNFADNQAVFFPEPYAELSSQRVLTMDMLEGVNLSERDALHDSGFDLEALAETGAKVFVEMVFRDGFYHADPHPGNLMVLTNLDASAGAEERKSDSTHDKPADVLGVLDCGMVGRLDDALRVDIEQALVGIVRHNSEPIVQVVIRRGKTPDDLDTDELRFDIEDFVQEYGTQSLDQFDMGGCLTGIVEIIRRHQIIMPARVAMLLKMLIMLEGTSQQLSPTFSLAELIEPYGKKSIKEKFSPQRLLRKLETNLRDWDNLIEILPRDVGDILHRIKKGSFDVHLEHRRLEIMVNRLVLGVLAAALYMGSALLISQKVPPLARGVSVPGAAGCVIAAWLGYTVIRAIRRSGAGP